MQDKHRAILDSDVVGRDREDQPERLRLEVWEGPRAVAGDQPPWLQGLYRWRRRLGLGDGDLRSCRVTDAPLSQAEKSPEIPRGHDPEALPCRQEETPCDRPPQTVYLVASRRAVPILMELRNQGRESRQPLAAEAL